MTALTDGTTFYDVAGVDSKENPSRLYLKEHDGALLRGALYHERARRRKSISRSAPIILPQPSAHRDSSGAMPLLLRPSARIWLIAVRSSLPLAHRMAAYSGYVNLGHGYQFMQAVPTHTFCLAVPQASPISPLHRLIIRMFYTLSGVKVRSQVS